MTADAPTIAETITKIQAALRDYIEATYHVGHPTLIEQRRALLEEEGVLFRAPFIESTPRYQTGSAVRRPRPRRRGADALRKPDCPRCRHVRRCFTTRRTPTRPRRWSGRPRRLEPGYHHRHRAPVRPSRSSCRCWPSSPLRRRTSRSRSQTPAVRALILYPMNALVNDQLGSLAPAAGRSARHDSVHRLGRPSRPVRPLHQPNALSRRAQG